MAWLRIDWRGLALISVILRCSVSVHADLISQAKAKQELEEKVANDLKEMQEAEASAAADKAKPKTKTVRRKRKKGSSGGASGEL